MPFSLLGRRRKREEEEPASHGCAHDWVLVSRKPSEDDRCAVCGKALFVTERYRCRICGETYTRERSTEDHEWVYDYYCGTEYHNPVLRLCRGCWNALTELAREAVAHTHRTVPAVRGAVADVDAPSVTVVADSLEELRTAVEELAHAVIGPEHASTQHPSMPYSCRLYGMGYTLLLKGCKAVIRVIVPYRVLVEELKKMRKRRGK